MPKRLTSFLTVAGICGLLSALAWWFLSQRAENAGSNHPHAAGSHGGVIVPLGRDHYHAEIVFTTDGGIRIFLRGQDETKIVDVPVQDVQMYLRGPTSRTSQAVVLKPDPQPGDPPGRTSTFVAALPADLREQTVIGSVTEIRFDNERYGFRFAVEAKLGEHEQDMPTKVTDDAEKSLYLKPAGKYSAADIKANGSVTASQKYRGFLSAHDRNPKSGEAICPVTQTKANAKCTWVVDGKTYAFCCPPCIDEFVRLAKETPEKIREPQAYVKE